MNVKHSPSDKDEFRNFLSCVFSKWTGLQLAINQGMGGSHNETSKKVSNMIDVVANTCFSKNTAGWQDISIVLEDLMDSYFNTVFDEDTTDLDEIGELLWNYSQKWLAGEKDSVRTYVAK